MKPVAHPGYAPLVDSALDSLVGEVKGEVRHFQR
jgi:hypothetical protein